MARDPNKYWLGVGTYLSKYVNKSSEIACQETRCRLQVNQQVFGKKTSNWPSIIYNSLSKTMFFCSEGAFM